MDERGGRNLERVDEYFATTGGSDGLNGTSRPIVRHVRSRKEALVPQVWRMHDTQTVTSMWLRRGMVSLCALGMTPTVSLACAPPSTQRVPFEAGRGSGQLDASAELDGMRGDRAVVVADDAPPSVPAPTAIDVARLEARVSALEGLLAAATADGGYSLGATYCGTTAPTTGAFYSSGKRRGYAAAKTKCEVVAACSSSAAHMCTADELVRTRQLGKAVPEGWYSAGVSSRYIEDCDAWAANNGGPSGERTNYSGPVWRPEGPGSSNCAEPERVLCCR